MLICIFRFSKLISIVPSLFSSAYVLNWSNHFPSDPLKPCDAPTFDARATPYPLEHEIRDYLSWRQEDCELHLETVPCSEFPQFSLFNTSVNKGNFQEVQLKELSPWCITNECLDLNLVLVIFL